MKLHFQKNKHSISSKVTKQFHTLILLFFLLIFTGCSININAKSKTDIIGEWQSPAHSSQFGEITNYYNFKANGTYIAKMWLKNQYTTLSQTGNYSIDDHFIYIIVKEKSRKIRYNLKGKNLILFDGGDTQIIYKRLP